MNRFFKNLFGTKTKTTRKTGFRPTCEMLEARRLAAGDIQFANGLLTINGGDFMDVAKVEVSGNLVVAKLWSSLNTNVVLNPSSLPAESDSTTVNFEIRSELASAVTKVKFDGRDGNDHFRNLTSEQSLALGGNGNDSLQGGRYFDELVGGTGDDAYLFAGDKIGTVIVNDAAYRTGLGNGGGIDTLDFSGMFRAIKIDLANTDQQVVAPEIPDGTYDNSMAIQLGGSQIVTTSSGASQTVYYGSQIENVKGSNYADVILGNSYANRLEGRHDSDRLEGREGNDTLVGGTGDDTYCYVGTSVGDDTITELTGGGTDWLNYSGFGAGISVFLGQDSQTVNHTHDVQLDLTNPEELENVIGTAYGDWLFGNERANQLEGRGSADTLEGRGGDDSLIGGSGNDTYVWSAGGNYGHDTITEAANTATDTLDFSNAGLGVGSHLQGFYLDLARTSRQPAIVGHLDLTLSSSTGIEDFIGSNQTDRVQGNGRNNMMDGRDGSDVMYGRDGNDELHGGWGNDQLFGDAGADDLYGEGHDDWLVGGDDGDWIYGGSGRDTLEGGDATDYLFGEGDDDELYSTSDDTADADDDDDDHLDGGDGWDFWSDGYLQFWD